MLVSVPARSDCTVCWLTGRSLRVKRSVRQRKGDSGDLEVFRTRGGGNEQTR